MEHRHHYIGLTEIQVLESRKQHGENILTAPEKESIWLQFLKKFTDPIIIILLVALALSVGVSCYQFFTGDEPLSVFLEPVGILIAVLLATVVGFCFELSANKKFELLNKVNDDTLIKVIRNGNICQIVKKEVVVGDIVILEAGEEVPADGELLEAISLQINESTLTGEPVIKKTTNPGDFDKDATYPSNQALKGTTIADGHGIMQVRKVGDATEYGKVYEGSQIDSSVETPLNKQLDRLADLITKASYAIAILIVVGRLIVYLYGLEAFDWINFGGYLLKTVMIAVTVIVVAVPEGLPMSVTLSLALSMKRMLSTNNLVRKMHACETMGATTVICTDKTGTLTQNQMKVYQTNFYELKNQELKDDEISKLIKESISINSTAYLDYSDASRIKALGNPTEGALLLWLHENKINYLSLRENAEIVEQLTFSTERKYMATIVHSPLFNKKVLYIKGAPEIVLGLCTSAPVAKAEIETQLIQYQNQAMRTLGFAYQMINDDKDYIKDDKWQNTDLKFLGIVAISDPVREEVPDAVKSCLSAGINVKIVTGDTPGTAKEIGRQIGLWQKGEPESRHLTGTDFAAMSDSELLERIVDLKILSRARPMDKQRLVQLLQEKDQVVAVTGDGTNDAPALNVAQVGLSMGDGTSVAKEASDITILDNSFSSISRAVMWGRSLYQNIQRFILFQMTVNVAACLIVLIGAFLGTKSPLTVTQMLWVNLIMDTFAALALASLPPSEKVMKDKPRKTSDHIISKPMTKRILGVGLLFVFLLYGLLQYFKHADITTLTKFSLSDFGRSFFDFSTGNGLSSYELSLFFTIFVLLQFWNMFNAKAFMTGKSTFASLLQCSGFLSIGLVILMGQILIVTVGGKMFNVTPIHTHDWVIIVGATSVILWFGEIARIIKNKIIRNNS
ncbi:Calcium-transporting ATPase 1 [termite gut metagenome]|uniref:P-type Ca(2+) transporter n=1 Tax=termite gut metagenome TaxID=433724 RepID=A0A5J4RYN7_9ZZZZ